MPGYVSVNALARQLDTDYLLVMGACKVLNIAVRETAMGCFVRESEVPRIRVYVAEHLARPRL